MKFFKDIKSSGLTAAAVIVAIGLAIGGYFIGNGVYQSWARRTVTVRGFAERYAVADLAVWNINFSRTGADLAGLQQGIDNDIASVTEFLKNAGFEAEEIMNNRVRVRNRNEFHHDPRAATEPSFTIETGVMVRTAKVDLVDATSRRLGELVRLGIAVMDDHHGPVYIFNGLNDIRMSMIEEATQSATEAGLQFAKDANARLGRIHRANQGVFTINPRDPLTNWTSERESIHKRVRVVSTITFYLK